MFPLVQRFASLYIVDEEAPEVACRQYRSTFEQYLSGASFQAAVIPALLAICAIAAQRRAWALM